MLKFLIIFCLFIFIKINTLSCDDNVQEALILLKKYLLEELKELIVDKDFINDFGRSKLNPRLITLYYTYFISDETFLKKFLDDTVTITFIKDNLTNTPKVIRTKILEKFFEHIIKDQTFYEFIINKIVLKTVLFICTPKMILKIVEIIDKWFPE